MLLLQPSFSFLVLVIYWRHVVAQRGMNIWVQLTFALALTRLDEQHDISIVVGRYS